MILQITYNFKESDSVREIYKLLNDYYKPVVIDDDKKAEENKHDDEDILDQLSGAIEKTKEETKEKTYKFKSLDSGSKGLGFIRADIDDFHELIVTIIADLATTKVKRTRFTNRIIPIEKVCSAKIDDIMNAAGEIFDKHFLKEPCTYAINFNHRCNNDFQRDEVIKQLAELINLKNIKNKVDLRNPQKTVIVEIVKGLCLLSVVPDYVKYKKYNLNEIAKVEEKNE